jgi:hypothetical protein
LLLFVAMVSSLCLERLERRAVAEVLRRLDVFSDHGRGWHKTGIQQEEKKGGGSFDGTIGDSLMSMF